MFCFANINAVFEHCGVLLPPCVCLLVDRAHYLFQYYDHLTGIYAYVILLLGGVEGFALFPDDLDRSETDLQLRVE